MRISSLILKGNLEALQAERGDIFTALRAAGIGVNVHYIPVHLHPYYRRQFGTEPGLCPVAEAAYEQIISLPIYPGITDKSVDEVIAAVLNILNTSGNP